MKAENGRLDVIDALEDQIAEARSALIWVRGYVRAHGAIPNVGREQILDRVERTLDGMSNAQEEALTPSSLERFTGDFGDAYDALHGKGEK